jgi:thiamine pyrophosphokinase
MPYSAQCLRTHRDPLPVQAARLLFACLAARRRTHNFNSLWLLNNHSYVTLVNPPAAFVALHPGLDGPTCGILPVGTPPSTVTTTGLRWNLSPALKLQYGGIVSSSNHAEESTIGITTDAKILFTAELHLEACIKAIATSLAPQ